MQRRAGRHTSNASQPMRPRLRRQRRNGRPARGPGSRLVGSGLGSSVSRRCLPVGRCRSCARYRAAIRSRCPVFEGAGLLSSPFHHQRQRETPRLCRGGSSSLTFPEVDHPTKLPIVSRQAHERRPHRWIGVHCKEMHQEGKSLDSIPGPQVQLGMRVEVRSSGRTKELLSLPSHHLGAASAAPNSAALSGSIPKAPGSAGGYLLVERQGCEGSDE